MTYVDCFVAAVPTDNREAYLTHTTRASEVFRDHGATEIVECWGDEIPDGQLTSFPLAVKCEPHETVVMGWVRWPSKAVRDAGMPKVMADPRMSHGENPMPMDGKRLIYGGFSVLLEA